METRGEYTREEIFSQPDAWIAGIGILQARENEIREFRKESKPAQIIFTGCGSTYYLSCAASMIAQEMTGIPAIGVPGSELWLSPDSYYQPNNETILVAISRSGETTETLRACEAFKLKQTGRLITLVCDGYSSLAQMGALNLIFPSGMEKSVAQTRAFSTLYLGAAGLIQIWAQRVNPFDQLESLPTIARKILVDSSSLAESLGKDLAIDSIYFLGSGSRFGLARELSLKMKEMALTNSEAFHFLEFRHGPKAMVSRKTLIVGLVSEMNARHELAVLEEMGELGAEVISVGERNTDISFNSGLEEVNRNILYLPFGQMLAYERSITKGLDPDQPKHLDPVVKLIL